MHKSVVSVLAFLAVTSLSPALSFAHGGATGVVKERMDIMSHVGATMKLLVGMSKGSVDFDAAKAAEATRQMSESLTDFPALLHAGTGDAPSEAAPLIWAEMDNFKKLVTDMEAASGDATVTLENMTDPSQIEAIVSDLGATCKACHAKYRIKR